MRISLGLFYLAKIAEHAKKKGCKVVIAKVNKKDGRQAAQRLNREYGPGAALFVRIDVGDEGSVQNLARRAEKAYGRVDIVLNNATIAPLGAKPGLGALL